MTIQELEQCIALYGKDIYSFCMHLTGNKERADDLYQDTFLEAMKKIKEIKYRENPKSYLLSIAVRLWKNQVRKAVWRNRIAPQVNEEAAAGLSEVACQDFFDQMISEEEKKLLWKAIFRLSDHLRIPILLYYMEELSIAEIAVMMKIPQGTVKSRLYHARKQLEISLKEDFS